MGFREQFVDLAAKVLERRKHIRTEESAKQSLIIPFINLLGYDAADPLEVCPEYSAGFKRAQEKVDYAILKNGHVIMLIEAKSVQDDLRNHDEQLSKYFNATPDAKIGILTNGVNYQFYSDLKQPNLIDRTPFFQLDFENWTDADVEYLQEFSRDNFDVEGVVALAEELAYTSKMKALMIDLLRNPSEELVRLILKMVDPKIRITQSIVQRYRPITKSVVADAMVEMFRQGVVQEPRPTDQIAKSNEESPDEVTEVDRATEAEGHERPRKSKSRTSLPKMPALFEWGLIKAGDVVYLKSHPDKVATVVNERQVRYQDTVLSFSKWGKVVTGWQAINIYDWTIVKGQSKTLAELRQEKMECDRFH